MDIFRNEILQPIFTVINEKPDNKAFCINEVYYTYCQLGEALSKIRTRIKNVSSSGENIGLVVNDDLETYASILALWAEGKAYVPLHPKQPIERCVEIVRQVHCSLILDSSSCTRYDGQVINTGKLIHEENCLELDVEYPGENLAYILFTSGSTGYPKGVTICRKNLTAFATAFREVGIVLTEMDRCLQCFDLTFDVSVESFVLPLMSGACVYTIPHEQIKWNYLYGLLDDHKITFGAMAPSMLRYLRPYFDEMYFPCMKCCIMTAEASPVELIEEWSTRIPNAKIYDFYGPTEATIYCTCYEFKRGGHNKMQHGILSIGKPMSGIEILLVDQERRPLPIGEKGELCVAGEQLTPGYWEDIEKNKRVFLDLIIDGKVRRFYCTGDLCYQDEEGDLMYYGRLDSQVKIQGYRVELSEIEYQVREFLEGINAVAVVFYSENGNAELGITIESSEFDTRELIAFLKSKLPSYMIPSKIVFVPSFPLNANSKVDRKLLKELF